MSIKQDRIGARTATDLERKYNFGKTFAEMLGLINDSRDKVDSVESQLVSVENSTKLMRDEMGVVVQAQETITSKVDGIDQSIAGINGDIENINSDITGINGDITGINGSINGINGSIDGINENITEISKTVEMKLDADAVSFAIEEKLTGINDSITGINGSITGINGDIESINSDITGINGSIEGINNNITEITNSVEMKLDAKQVNIAIKNQIANGVDEVVITETGYSFGSNGLQISKTDSGMSNLIDNTGMYVKRYGSEVLTANNQGVGAVNLHAKTYLIIGSGDGRSRIEDYDINRTGVFWIGG